MHFFILFHLQAIQTQRSLGPTHPALLRLPGSQLGFCHRRLPLGLQSLPKGRETVEPRLRRLHDALTWLIASLLICWGERDSRFFPNCISVPQLLSTYLDSSRLCDITRTIFNIFLNVAMAPMEYISRIIQNHYSPQTKTNLNLTQHRRVSPLVFRDLRDQRGVLCQQLPHRGETPTVVS